MPFILLLIFSWLLNLFLPWWSVLIPSFFIGAWLMQKSLSSFITGFFAVGLAWGLHAFYIHIANDGILSGRIAEMMQLQSAYLVLLFTFLIGAFLGASGTTCGFYFKKVFSRNV